ncbi:hypothetical protein [Wolbachia endosymbiont (group A) of Chalcis sispes]|uniref:hypothetical protein n=1 Tax=Wolbachia endosymbiont (group A) of Chalcis sispes TaxID=3066197 RepID=UPI003132AA52
MGHDDKARVIFNYVPPVIVIFAAYGLRVTTSSPLVIGGIIGSIFPALFTAVVVGNLLYTLYKGDSIEEFDKKALIYSGISTAVSAAIGVGLAAAATAIFPSAMLGMGSAALAGATIGVIAPIAGLLAAVAIISAAEKVNEHIISPIIKHFSSKGKEV